MKKAFPTLFIGFILIAILDIFGSIASRVLNFNYSNLSPISFVFYSGIPFLIAKHGVRKTAVISGGLLGLFDVTVGLKLSIMLKANFGAFNVNAITPPVFVIMCIIMTSVASLFGLLGYWFAKKLLPVSTNK